MIRYLMLLLCCEAAMSGVEDYCDRFPAVTDLSPEDCDNANNYYYRERGDTGCFPACMEAARLQSCGALPCPPGYYCANNRCALDSESCYRYYVSQANAYTRAKWKPTCLPDESWAPKQCKGEAANGRCFCFDGQGNRIFGEAFSLDAEEMTCACSRRRAEMERAAIGGPMSQFISIHCDGMGNYDPLQCDVISEQCWCVEPRTGDLTSTVVPSSLMARLPCYNATTVGSQYLRQCESQLYAQARITDEFNAHGTQRLNFPTVLCQYDGSYGPYKIINGIVYCVNKDGTNLGSYQSALLGATETVNCNCARDEQMYTQAGLPFALSCRANGNYDPIQMDGNQFYCVDGDGFIKSDNFNQEPSCATYM